MGKYLVKINQENTTVIIAVAFVSLVFIMGNGVTIAHFFKQLTLSSLDGLWRNPFSPDAFPHESVSISTKFFHGRNAVKFFHE